MSVPIDNWQYPNNKVVYMKPWIFFGGLALLVVIGLVIMFHESVSDYFASLSPAPANSIRGEWVGVLDMPNIRDPWVRPLGKQAVIRFTLSRSDHFLNKYGGAGELVIEGQQAQPVQVTDLWLSKTPPQNFEVGIWKVPLKQNDPKDYVSGGFEGNFKDGQLKLTRQITTGYDQLVQQMRSKESSGEVPK
jgi:hypothetical protein